jgi:indole-3-glycerol phosphate synthase
VSGDFLKKIAQYKWEHLKAKKAYYENLKKNMKPSSLRRYEVFKKAISKPGGINLIAEIKKASPSAGLIREDFNATKIAGIYLKNNAAAISVLTEDKYFLGKFAYLSKVSENCKVPVLMKDFVVHEYQIYEGLFYGASAVLLIVSLLEQSDLQTLIKVSHSLGLDVLVEVHSQAEIDRALCAGAQIIGVNNRNLQTLKVDVNNCLKLIPRIPKGIIIVAESGLKTHDDVIRVHKAGAHAVLMGEVFMRAPDIGAKIKEVMYGAC